MCYKVQTGEQLKNFEAWPMVINVLLIYCSKLFRDSNSKFF